MTQQFKVDPRKNRKRVQTKTGARTVTAGDRKREDLAPSAAKGSATRGPPTRRAVFFSPGGHEALAHAATRMNLENTLLVKEAGAKGHILSDPIYTKHPKQANLQTTQVRVCQELRGRGRWGGRAVTAQWVRGFLRGDTPSGMRRWRRLHNATRSLKKKH